RLDSIIRKNIVPPKPIYVLILLQMFEAYSQQNLELTSHGHCYQQLVYQAFDNAGIPKDEVDRYLNVLTELAWDIHLNQDGLDQYQVKDFFIKYTEKYLSVDSELIINKLKQNSILTERNDRIQFKYPYLFYFFAAKKIAEYYSTDDVVKENTKVLLDGLHREDYANILVFVTHHTKDKWVLDEINESLSCLFVEHEVAILSKEQLAFMSDFVAQIPELIMETREIKTERNRHNDRLDAMEKNNYDDGNEPPDILAKINKTFKGMEIAGQIIRNRHATLTRADLFNLASQGSNTGLRFLDYFIYLSDTTKKEVLNIVENALREHPDLTNDQISKQATKFFLHMTYSVINGVIRKIASSIGSKEAAEIYATLGGENQSPAIILLIQAIELQFKREVNIGSISNTAAKLNNNPVCMRILKEMIIQHTYMFPVEYRDKQKLDSLLKLSVKTQRMMENEKNRRG
ncbi:TPA: toll-Interleukin receptor, partial [Yersinia enterocolitica]|nr:toll-Interleukin receptor [Yersinia enterocolitica]